MPAANGTMIIAATEPSPVRNASTASTGRFGAAALSASAMMFMTSRPVSSGRRRRMSPSGTTNRSPAAYPSWVTVTSAPAAAPLVPNVPAIASSSGWA